MNRNFRNTSKGKQIRTENCKSIGKNTQTFWEKKKCHDKLDKNLQLEEDIIMLVKSTVARSGKTN